MFHIGYHLPLRSGEASYAQLRVMAARTYLCQRSWHTEYGSRATLDVMVGTYTSCVCFRICRGSAPEEFLQKALRGRWRPGGVSVYHRAFSRARGAHGGGTLTRGNLDGSLGQNFWRVFRNKRMSPRSACEPGNRTIDRTDVQFMLHLLGYGSEKQCCRRHSAKPMTGASFDKYSEIC